MEWPTWSGFCDARRAGPFSLQLFIGTLLFTILVFLLPTTALYYLVFTLVSSVPPALGPTELGIGHCLSRAHREQAIYLVRSHQHGSSELSGNYVLVLKQLGVLSWRRLATGEVGTHSRWMGSERSSPPEVSLLGCSPPRPV